MGKRGGKKENWRVIPIKIIYYFKDLVVNIGFLLSYLNNTYDNTMTMIYDMHPCIQRVDAGTRVLE